MAQSSFILRSSRPSSGASKLRKARCSYRVVHPLIERVSFKVSSRNDTREFVDGVFDRIILDIKSVEELLTKASKVSP